MSQIPVNVTITPEAPAQASANQAKAYAIQGGQHAAASELAQGLSEAARDLAVSAANTLAALIASLDEVLAVQGDLTEINAVYAKLTEIQAVYTALSSINAVAASIDNVSAVADNLVEINEVHAQLDKLLQLLENLGTYEAVAALSTEIAALYANLTALQSLYANLTALLNLNTNLASVQAVEGKLEPIEVVATNMEDVQLVAENISNINAVADDLGLGVGSKVTIVADSIANVNTVAGEIEAVALAASKMAEIEAAPGAATDAATARDKAEEWAEKAEDVEVEAGKYSAKHHAAKAEGFKDEAAASVVEAETLAASIGLGGIFWPETEALRLRVIADEGVFLRPMRLFDPELDAIKPLNPSLVMIPAAIKAGKLHSVIPADGSGDFTIDRASSAEQINEGVYETIGANLPVFDTVSNVKLLAVLEESTNHIRNNTMVGAGVGTPGALPTYWAEVLAGLTREVVAIGSENGLNYIDIRLHGTATSTATMRIAFGIETSIVAAVGEVWTQSVYAKLVSASQPPINYRILMIERNAAGSFLGGGDQAVTPTSTLTRYSLTRTLNQPTTGRLQPTFAMDVTNGQSYDFTIRFGLPQLEKKSARTRVIKTAGTAATRLATVIPINLPEGVTQVKLYDAAEAETIDAAPTNPWYIPIGIWKRIIM